MTRNWFKTCSWGRGASFIPLVNSSQWIRCGMTATVERWDTSKPVPLCQAHKDVVMCGHPECGPQNNAPIADKEVS